MNNDLASKVLRTDSVPYGLLPRYVLWGKPAFVYHSKEKKNVKIIDSEEILVPMTEEDVNWDEIFLQMLSMCVENDSDRDIVVKDLQNWSKYFDDNDIDAKQIIAQIIAHPSCPHIGIPLVSVHTSLLCPEDTVFVLLEPQYLGVLATRDNREEYGMSIIGPEYVVRYTIETE